MIDEIELKLFLDDLIFWKGKDGKDIKGVLRDRLDRVFKENK